MIPGNCLTKFDNNNNCLDLSPNDQNTQLLSNNSDSSISSLTKSFEKLEIKLSVSPMVKAALLRVIDEVGSLFHKLSENEIDQIATEINKQFSLKGKSHLLRKQGKITRTIYYDFDKRIAYIFLKTKGGLPRHVGGFKSGTRVLEIVWSPDPKKIEANKCFILASLDKREECEFLHNVPFEVSVLSKIEALKSVTLQCKMFFSYTKYEKATFNCIKKSAAIYPFVQCTLADHFKLAGIQDFHKVATFHGISQALKILHEAGITHGDLKARNILINEEGKPILADFDFGSDLKTGEKRVRSQSYGTLQYTAPEHLMCQDKNLLDLRALDIWAFGIMIKPLCSYEFLGLRQLEKQEPVDDTLLKSIALKRQIIYNMQLLHDRQATKADSTLQTVDNPKDFLIALGEVCLHPKPGYRPTASKIILYIESRFELD